MSDQVDHTWTYSALQRLREAAVAVGRLRTTAVELHGHIWEQDEGYLDQIERDVAEVRAVLARRKADQPKLEKAA